MLHRVLLLVIQAVVLALKRFFPAIGTIQPAVEPLPEVVAVPEPAPAPGQEAVVVEQVVVVKEDLPKAEVLPEPALDVAFELTLLDETKDSTVSKLRHRGEYLCLILEDGFRAKKEPGYTRIAPGVYELVKYKSPKFYQKYRKQFGHKYLVLLKEVSGFSGILVHIGCTVRDTLGCLLTGTKHKYIEATDLFEVEDSTEAYLKWYEAVDAEFEKGGQVYLKIER